MRLILAQYGRRNGAKLALARQVRLILEGLKAERIKGWALRCIKVAAGVCVAAALSGAEPAMAGLSDMTVAPLSFPVGSAELTIHGEASGALFWPDQPGQGAKKANGTQVHGTQASGALRLMPTLRRDYDSGLALSLEAAVAASDPLSRGRYDGDALERLAGVVRTGLGTLQIGLADGAGYDLAVMGPRVDPGVSLDDPRTSFFRDPASGRAVTDLFALRTQVGASSNYAKFAYASPEIFGVQLALSFTPSEGKQLPFMNAGPHVPGRQADIWEAALRVSQEIGPVTVSAYGGFATGRAEHKLPGQHGVSDAGFGVRADYPLDDEITVSLGSAYRTSNAYGFDINRSYGGPTTRVVQVSGMVSDGAWSAGLEYGNGIAGSAPGTPRIGLNGLEASVGYQFNSSIGASTGWQHLTYDRSSGAFFDGSSRLSMDAVFIHLNLKTSQ